MHLKLIFAAVLSILTLFPLGLQAARPEEDLDAKYGASFLGPGTKAPDFTLGDIRGESRSLSEFRGRKVVLVFWASWCPDCRAEVPELKAMQAQADPEKTAFVSISFDRSFDAFKTYVEENYIGGVQLFDPAGKKDSAIGAAYGVQWIPSLFLIDEKGRVVLATVLAEKVAKALKTESKKTNPFQRGVCSETGCAPR